MGWSSKKNKSFQEFGKLGLQPAMSEETGSQRKLMNKCDMKKEYEEAYSGLFLVRVLRIAMIDVLDLLLTIYNYSSNYIARCMLRWIYPTSKVYGTYISIYFPNSAARKNYNRNLQPRLPNSSSASFCNFAVFWVFPMHPARALYSQSCSPTRSCFIRNPDAIMNH